MTSSENADLIDTLDRHRAFLLHTAEGLCEEQARTTSTVSALTVASLLKHVADTERDWMTFARGEQTSSDVYDADVDWNNLDASAADPRFVLSEADTLDALRDGMGEVAAQTRAFLATADLDIDHALPSAPWFEPGTRWTVRRVALHMIAEIAQHAGHADIIREAIDGQKTMG